MNLEFPNGLNEDRFLADYWQKKPLLMRNALPGFVSPLDADELAGLSLENDVESRLITGTIPARRKLEQGPFNARRFADLPTTGWTILIQDVDKHLPDLASVLDPFSFLPAWRIDDLMVSFAADEGGVGAHFDQYDVFLIQGQGQRHWGIAIQFDHTRVSQTDIDELLIFEPEEEYLLNPGDVLYLPPGVAHRGESVGSSISYSVGFRAPTLQEMLHSFADYVSRPVDPELHYADADLSADEALSGKISAQAINRAKTCIDLLRDADDAMLARWFGSLVTEPKVWLRAQPRDLQVSTDTVAKGITGGGDLRRHGMALYAWTNTDSGCLLFVDGASRSLSVALQPVLEHLCGRRIVPNYVARQWLDDRLALDLITDLINQGVLEISSDAGP